MLYEPQFGRILLNISLSDPRIKDKTTKGKNVEFDLPYYFSKLLQIANFDVSWYAYTLMEKSYEVFSGP